MFKIFLIFLTGCVFLAQAGEDQGASVQGKIYCNGEPAVALKVKLIDTDFGSPDDLMSKGLTDKDGYYSLSGYSSDLFGSIDPVVEVKYKCGTMFDKCYSFKIPEKFVTSGKIPTKPFSAPDIELSSVKSNC